MAKDDKKTQDPVVQPPADEAKWSVYVAQRDIDHNRKLYKAGKELRLSEDEAESLLAIGAVAARDPKAK